MCGTIHCEQYQKFAQSDPLPTFIVRFDIYFIIPASLKQEPNNRVFKIVDKEAPTKIWAIDPVYSFTVAQN